MTCSGPCHSASMLRVTSAGACGPGEVDHLKRGAAGAALLLSSDRGLVLCDRVAVEGSADRLAAEPVRLTLSPSRARVPSTAPACSPANASPSGADRASRGRRGTAPRPVCSCPSWLSRPSRRANEAYAVEGCTMLFILPKHAYSGPRSPIAGDGALSSRNREAASLSPRSTLSTPITT